MSADGALTIADARASVRIVHDPVPVLDTARFEHMQRVAAVMAEMTLVPDALRMTKSESGAMVPLSPRQVLANCFLVVNQATRWGMDPFAVAQCVSVVHGKLTYEGKLVAAVLDAKLGVQLTYAWTGDGERMSVVVSGTLPDGRIETVDGTVAEWKTTGKGSPWHPANYRKMLAYRGAREWARLHAPAVMLGVYSPDEFDQLSRNARDITPTAEPARVPPPAPPPAAALHSAPNTAPPPPAGRPETPIAHSPGVRSGPPPAPPAPPPEQADAPLQGGALLAHIESELDACGDRQTIEEAWDGFEPLMDRLARNDRQTAEDMLATALKRVESAHV